MRASPRDATNFFPGPQFFSSDAENTPSETEHPNSETEIPASEISITILGI
jgi:hypothetical protein